MTYNTSRDKEQVDELRQQYATWLTGDLLTQREVLQLTLRERQGKIGTNAYANIALRISLMTEELEQRGEQ